MIPDEQRHSQPLDAEIIVDPQQRAEQEARNGIRQFDAVLERVDYWLQPERPFKLRPSAILDLNRIALEGINGFAGIYRPTGIEIKGSPQVPPLAHLVAGLVEEFCDYINDNWERSALHLAAYALWRLN